MRPGSTGRPQARAGCRHRGLQTGEEPGRCLGGGHPPPPSGKSPSSLLEPSARGPRRPSCTWPARLGNTGACGDERSPCQPQPCRPPTRCNAVSHRELHASPRSPQALHWGRRPPKAQKGQQARMSAAGMNNKCCSCAARGCGLSSPTRGPPGTQLRCICTWLSRLWAPGQPSASVTPLGCRGWGRAGGRLRKAAGPSWAGVHQGCIS